MRQALNHSYRFPQRAESVRTLCIRLPKVVLFLFLLLGAGSLAAQNTDQQIAAQKRLIADLEKQIAREEQEISKLKKGRASAEETVRRLYSVRLRQNQEAKRERVASGIPENVGGDGTVKKRPTRVVKVGRNDLCPCGSGLKWKKCTCKEYHS